jgi:hypothetical protein
MGRAGRESEVSAPRTSVWRLIVCATPLRLLAELLLYLLVHPGKKIPADLQQRLGRAWAGQA